MMTLEFHLLHLINYQHDVRQLLGLHTNIYMYEHQLGRYVNVLLVTSEYT